MFNVSYLNIFFYVRLVNDFKLQIFLLKQLISYHFTSNIVVNLYNNLIIWLHKKKILTIIIYIIGGKK